MVRIQQTQTEELRCGLWLLCAVRHAFELRSLNHTTALSSVHSYEVADYLEGFEVVERNLPFCPLPNTMIHGQLMHAATNSHKKPKSSSKTSICRFKSASVSESREY